MKRPPLSSLLSLIVFHAVATCSVDAAPSTEEMLAEVPNPIIGPEGNNPNQDFTNWTIWEISNLEGRAVVTYRSVADLRDGNGHPNFVVTSGYFQSSGSTIIGPTATFIEATRPNDLDGGTWQFRYVALEVPGLTSFRDVIGYSHVAYWTWTESLFVVDPDPETPAGGQSPIVQKNLGMGVDLGNAVSRAVRGKNPRRALQLLGRQQRLLMRALVSEN